jgi:hypothetical protein
MLDKLFLLILPLIKFFEMSLLTLEQWVNNPSWITKFLLILPVLLEIVFYGFMYLSPYLVLIIGFFWIKRLKDKFY